MDIGVHKLNEQVLNDQVPVFNALQQFLLEAI